MLPVRHLLPSLGIGVELVRDRGDLVRGRGSIVVRVLGLVVVGFGLCGVVVRVRDCFGVL